MMHPNSHPALEEVPLFSDQNGALSANLGVVRCQLGRALASLELDLISTYRRIMALW